jgi:hypothetical protein
MRKLIVIAAVMLAAPAYAAGDVFHYACKGEGSRYAVTVDTGQGIVKMQDHGASN